MDIVITRFKKEQTENVEKHFSNLHFLKDFVDNPDKDVKVSESGKKANMRLPKIGKIISVALEKSVDENETDGHKCSIVKVSAPAIDSKIKFIFDYLSNETTIISVHGDFNPILGPINSFIFRNFVEDKLEDIVRSKIEKIAQN